MFATTEGLATIIVLFGLALSCFLIFLFVGIRFFRSRKKKDGSTTR